MEYCLSPILFQHGLAFLPQSFILSRISWRFYTRIWLTSNWRNVTTGLGKGLPRRIMFHRKYIWCNIHCFGVCACLVYSRQNNHTYWIYCLPVTGFLQNMYTGCYLCICHIGSCYRICTNSNMKQKWHTESPESCTFNFKVKVLKNATWYIVAILAFRRFWRPVRSAAL